jgi:23S rRNA U2552 (ribose-2'-O)-methylase RlmE/FtsJ
VVSGEEIPCEMVSNSLSRFLYSIKEKIHTYEKEWDIYKKYTNHYEFIHTVIQSKKKAVSKYKPLSRSYFKMVEIVHELQLLPNHYDPLANSTANTFNVRAYGLKPHSLAYTQDVRASGSISETAFRERPEPSLRPHVNKPNSSELRSSVLHFPEFPRIPSATRPECFTNSFEFQKDNTKRKELELLATYKQPPTMESSPIKTFHLAEGPGGFIEAVVHMRKNPKDVYVGMTILDDKNNYSIPAWKKSDYFLSNNPNVIVEKGADETGNILSIQNFDYCYEKYRSQMDFITADGGFDFSTDFNKQELHISRLLYAQIAYALIMQKYNGNFVLKIFDCFYSTTVDLLFLLSSFYKTVYITKPQTSRTGNSEKYVVCKGFLYHSTDVFHSFIRNGFIQMVNPKIDTHYIYRLLQKPIPLSFVVKVEEYNSIFGQHQIENIHSTLSMIEKNVKQERFDFMVKHNITKCIQWCIRYNVPYHNFTTNNAFM